MATLPCFVCNKELESVFNAENQPYDALEFYTEGHYGSTFFDPMDGSLIILNICDDCLQSREHLTVRKTHGN